MRLPCAALYWWQLLWRGPSGRVVAASGVAGGGAYCWNTKHRGPSCARKGRVELGAWRAETDLGATPEQGGLISRNNFGVGCCGRAAGAGAGPGRAGELADRVLGRKCPFFRQCGPGPQGRYKRGGPKVLEKPRGVALQVENFRPMAAGPESAGLLGETFSAPENAKPPPNLRQNGHPAPPNVPLDRPLRLRCSQRRELRAGVLTLLGNLEPASAVSAGVLELLSNLEPGFLSY